MTNNSLKNRILIPLTLGLFSLLVVFLVSLFWIERNNIKIRVKHQFESSEHFFTSQQENDARLLVGLLESIMNDRAIQAAVKSKDRQALLSHTAPLFKRIAAYHPVTHLYFSDAQRINLLRVHQPDRYGDRIDRVTTLRAEKTGKIAYGLELGPLGTLTLRVVAPLFVDGKRIGFVELGEEIDHITAKFKKFLGVELIIHLHKKFLHRPGWEAGMKMLGRAYDWDRFPDVVLAEQTLPVNPEALAIFFSEGSHRAGTNDVEIVSQNRRFRGRFLVIKDVQGVQVGDMIVLIDVTGQVTRLYYTIGVIVLFSVFLGGVLFFLFRFFLGRVENQLTTAQQKIVDLEKDHTRMESEAKFYSVAQSVNDAMISSDPLGKITFWNPAAVIMFGYQEEEVLGQPLTKLIPERYREAHLKGMERLQSGGEPRMIGKTTELFGVKKDGTEFPLELSLARWTAGNETFYTGFIRDITQRKGAEEALRQSEEKYRTILESIEDGYYEVDLTGNFTFFNDALTRIHEHSRDEMMGMNNRAYTDAENSRLLYKDFNRVYRTGEPSKGIIYEVITKNGGRKNVETSISLIRDFSGKPIGFRGITRDITELRQAQKALLESEDRYRDLVENSQDLIYTHDLEGNLLSVNEAPVRLLGYSRESLLHMNLSDLLIPELRDRLGAYLKEIRSQGQASGIMRVQTVTNETHYWEYNNTLRTEGVTEPIVRGMAHDVTERMGAEREVRETLKKLRSAMGGIIQAVTLTVESRDPYTAGHQKRVSTLARSIAQEIGMPKDQVEAVRLAGMVHDLGKISVPAEILSKPSRLSDLEFKLIQIHPQTSYDILKDIDFPWPIARIALQHHERMDGSGYPAGLKGDEILLEAKVLMVADVVEAIASHRPYRPAYGIDAALGEIEKNKGILYDSELVDACLKLFREKGFRFE